LRLAELFEQIGRLKMEMEWLKKVGSSRVTPRIPENEGEYEPKDSE